MSRLKPGSSVGPFPYRIVKQLGAGSGNMSDVYLATVGDPETTSSFVVIKISKSQEDHSDFFEDTIFNEAERLRKLDHRGVVRILPIQTTNSMRVQPYAARAGNIPGNPWFLILEHLVGDSLADVLQNYRQLDTALALEIARKIAQTLEYLHYNDLVHLDLKPENILFRRPLEAGGRVEPVLIDFGIARNTGQAGLEGRTLHYAPPERVLTNRGNAPPETLPRPSPAMDIYSLGVVFYQMLAGRRPFEGRTARSISSAILEGKPTRPSKYSNLVWKELDDLVMDMLNRDPIRRPTAGELVERLDDLRAQPVYQLPASDSGQTVKIAAIRKRSLFAGAGKVLAALALLLLLAIGVGEALFYRQNKQIWTPNLADLQTAPGTIVAYVQTLSTGLLPGSQPPPVEPAGATPTGTPTVAPASETPAIVVPPVVAEISTETATPEEPTASPTITPIPTATRTSTPTATKSKPTSTPVTEITLPTPSPTPSPTKRAEIKNTVKSPTATAVPQHTSTATTVPATATPTAKPTNVAINTPRPAPVVNYSVALLEPASKTIGIGTDRFSWKPNFTLAKGQAFELIFWKEGQDPLVSGKGWFGTSTNTSTSGDLIKAGAPTDSYLWGVLLVQTNPYQRVKYLGGGWKYILQK